MTLFDITRELLSAPVYPGDTPPALTRVLKLEEGAAFNLTALTCSSHAGTHCDAPLHALAGGCDIAAMPLMHYVGPCYVLQVAPQTEIGADYLRRRMPEGTERLLLNGMGKAHFTMEGAKYLIEQRVLTVGTDAASVSAAQEEKAVHEALLSGGAALIEALDLGSVPEGAYLLCAPPLKIAGAEGAPCRAILMKL